MKPGTRDPDYPDIPLGGWAGTIVEMDRQGDPFTCLVEWNQRTLDHMHPVYRKRCQRDDLAFERMWLAEGDLDPDNGEPGVIEQPTNLISRPLSENDQDDRIRAVFGLTSDDPLPPADEENLRRYYQYLTARLSFPLTAQYRVETGPFQETICPVTVVGLRDPEGCDEEEGILCAAVQEGEPIELPLAEIEARTHRHGRRLIEDYAYWFTNWPADDWAGAATLSWVSPDPYPAVPDRWGSIGTLCRGVVFGGIYGVILGPVLAAFDGAGVGALVGGVILGFIGWQAGARYGTIFGAVNRIQQGPLLVGTFGALTAAPVGMLAGAFVVAFVGALAGGVIGGVIGRLLEKSGRGAIGPVWGTIAGAGIGAVVLAFCRDREKALTGMLHGGWVGAVAGILLVVVFNGLLRLAARRRGP